MMYKFGNHHSGINNLPFRNMTQSRHPVLFYGNYNLAATSSISPREEEGHFHQRDTDRVMDRRVALVCSCPLFSYARTHNVGRLPQ